MLHKALCKWTAVSLAGLAHPVPSRGSGRQAQRGGPAVHAARAEGGRQAGGAGAHGHIAHLRIYPLPVLSSSRDGPPTNRDLLPLRLHRRYRFRLWTMRSFGLRLPRWLAVVDLAHAAPARLPLGKPPTPRPATPFLSGPCAPRAIARIRCMAPRIALVRSPTIRFTKSPISGRVLRVEERVFDYLDCPGWQRSRPAGHSPRTRPMPFDPDDYSALARKLFDPSGWKERVYGDPTMRVLIILRPETPRCGCGELAEWYFPESTSPPLFGMPMPVRVAPRCSGAGASRCGPGPSCRSSGRPARLPDAVLAYRERLLAFTPFPVKLALV